jgi:hypothetical protein
LVDVRIGDDEHFPAVTCGIGRPHFVLNRVAARYLFFATHRDAGLFETIRPLGNPGRGFHLDSEVLRELRRGGVLGFVECEVQGRAQHLELGIAGSALAWFLAE